MLLAVGVLGGCVETTQQKNDRAQLRSERLLAGRSAVHVTRRDPHIAVLNVRMLRRSTGTAVAVTLRNDAASPVSDLPVSVGVRTPAGRTTYLNCQPELPYFQDHVPAIAAGSQVTWVYTSARPTPSGRPFAHVGPSAIAARSPAGHLPAIASSVISVRPQTRGHTIASVVVANRSDLTQDELEVYAYALSGGRLVAAGAASLGSLSSGTKRTTQIPLLGEPGPAVVKLDVPPTNLR